MSHSLNYFNFRMPGVDQSTVEREQFAYITVVELPFRIRLGNFFRFHSGPDRHIEIAGLNRYSLPSKKKYKANELPLRRDRNLVNTRIAVIEQPFAFKDASDLEELRRSSPFKLTSEAKEVLAQRPGPQLIVLPQIQRHTQELTRFIELYYIHCPPFMLGSGIRPFWTEDFLRRHVVLSGCLTGRGERVPSSFLKVLLRADNITMDEVDMGAIYEQDVKRSAKDRLARALLTDEPTLSDKLWMLSASYLDDMNNEMAVITAVAALESAVNVFARTRLKPVLGQKLTEDLLREQGMFVIIQVMPKLFFKRQPPPDEDTTKLVLRAIQARNALMHGAHDNTGTPKFYKYGHLGEEIYACKALIRCFNKELGRKEYPRHGPFKWESFENKGRN